MPPIDPSIPLAGRPYDIQAGANLGLAQQRYQAGNLDIQQAVAENQRQNALRAMLGGMQGQGSQGQMDQNQLRQIMSVDPKTGMQIGQQQGEAQRQQLLNQHYQDEHQAFLSDLAMPKPEEITQMTESQIPAMKTYLDYRKAHPGESKETAAAVAQKVFDDSHQQLESSGLLRASIFSRFPAKFDPVKAEAGIRKNNPKWAEANFPLTPSEAMEKEPAFVKELRASGIDPLSPEGKKILKKRMDRETAPTATQISLTGVGQPSADAMTLAVDQYLAGDSSAGQGFGRSAPMKAQFLNRLAERAKQLGMSGSDIATKMAEFQGTKAGERTLGTRTAQVEMAVTEAQNLMPLALAASNAVNRTNYPTLNKILLAGESGSGDENAVRLGIATNSLINVYARAVSPSGAPTVSDKDHARELLSSAWSKGQYAAGVDQLNKEMQAARRSPGQVKEEMRGGGGGTSGGWSDDKEKRYQELLKKQHAAQ